MGERLENLKMFGMGGLMVGVVLGSFLYFGDRREEFYPQRERVETKKDLKEKNFQIEVNVRETPNKETSRIDYGNSIPFIYEERSMPYIHMRKLWFFTTFFDIFFNNAL